MALSSWLYIYKTNYGIYRISVVADISSCYNMDMKELTNLDFAKT